MSKGKLSTTQCQLLERAMARGTSLEDALTALFARRGTENNVSPEDVREALRRLAKEEGKE